VTLTGTNFAAGATVKISDTNITVTKVTVASTTSITATFTIGGNATVGADNVTVTSGGVTTSAVTFTVTAAGAAPSNTVAITKATGGSVPLTIDANTKATLTFPPNSLPQDGSVTVTSVSQGNLPAPVTRAHLSRFTLNANNTYVMALQISVNPATITVFNVPVALSGNVNTNYSGQTLYIAMYNATQNTWVDVATVTVSTTGVLTMNLLSTTLGGILQPGTYLIYLPAAGTGTAVANYGIALIADDGNGIPPGGTNPISGIQVVNLYDANGNALATPTLKSMAFANAGDLDGDALTPDGKYGIAVDGGNTLRFFSGVSTGVPTASTTTIDISAYGGDGDSVAIMPNGDEAVVCGDGNSEMLLVSGVAAGNPMAAETIPCPDNRDSVVISNDGKVMLASKEGSGLTVFAIAAVTPAAGPLGGTVSHSFTQTVTFTSLPSVHEDGRGGMALSPVDSTRAVMLTSDGISLLTGLPGTAAVPPVATRLHLNVPSTPRRNPLRARAKHERDTALTGWQSLYSVSITPDGTSAVVGTDAGLILVSGVNTGSLAQVNATPFSPTYNVTLPGAAAASSANLQQVTTLGITLDGKYVVACDQNSNAVLTIPFNATGFSNPVGVLSDVAVPDNDQLLIH
jgi:hypothetical protein